MPARLETSDPRPIVRFRYNGRLLRGREGEPIAAALLANGIEVIHRSLKNHAPRGVRCAVGRCGQCQVNVDGRPNVRSCAEPLRDGMAVSSQRGWPAADFDLQRPLGLLLSHLPYGFHYRLFTRPAALRPTFFRMIRRSSGYGSVNRGLSAPDPPAPPRPMRDVDLLVIGGGVAGMACAIEATRSGAGPLLLDDQTELGGTARFDPRGGADRLAGDLRAECEVEALPERKVVGYDGGVVSAVAPGGIEKFRPRVLVIATGGYDFIPPFADNDGVRIFGERAALRILRGWGIAPAARAAVSGPAAEALADALSVSGLYCAVEPVSRAPGPDEAMVCAGSLPSHELQCVAGIAMATDERGAVVASLGEGGATSRPDVFVTGEAAGVCDHAEAARRGAETGRAAARALAGEYIPWRPARPPTSPEPQGPVPGAMLCFCEDVSEAEFAAALCGDYPDIESAKRFTSMSMGVCQGKYCLHRARCITAAISGKPLEDTPMTTVRPPFHPVTLGDLSAEPVSEGAPK